MARPWPPRTTETPQQRRARRQLQKRVAAEKLEQSRAARTILRLARLLPDGTFTDDTFQQMAAAVVDEIHEEDTRRAQKEMQKALKQIMAKLPRPKRNKREEPEMPKKIDETPEEKKARCKARDKAAAAKRAAKRGAVTIAELALLLPAGTYSEPTLAEIAAVGKAQGEALSLQKTQRAAARAAVLAEKARKAFEAAGATL